jgi:hypothetical protein
MDRQLTKNSSKISDDEKARRIAASFIDLYGPVAELQVAQRVLMFEADGNAPVVAAWRAVGEALARLRAADREGCARWPFQ